MVTGSDRQAPEIHFLGSFAQSQLLRYRTFSVFGFIK